MRAVEGARELLHDHLLARLRRNALVDGHGVGPELQHLDGDLVVPDAHVRVRPVGDGVCRRREHDWDPLRAPGGVQALHARDDHVHAVAGEGVALARPRVGEVDVDQRGTLTEAHAAHEAPVAVELGIGREDRLESPCDVVAHLQPPPPQSDLYGPLA